MVPLIENRSYLYDETTSETFKSRLPKTIVLIFTYSIIVELQSQAPNVTLPMVFTTNSY